MASPSTSTSLELTTEQKVQTTTEQKVVLPPLRKLKYHPRRAPQIYRALNYTDNMITTQEAMLEQLRWTRRQLEKDDKQLREMQHQLYLTSFSRRPTLYHSKKVPGSEEEEEQEEE